MVRAIFKNCVLAAAGPKEHSVDDLKSWTEQRKGRFSLDLDDSVTHLLCTDDQFKTRRKNQRIRTAEKRGKKAIRVVHVDWFTFSCTHNKKLLETDYNFSAVRRRENANIRKQLEADRKAHNTVLGETWINPDLYRIFTDRHYFRYEIQLLRTSETEDGTFHDKYELCLFESFAKPHLYWFGARLYQKTNGGVWRSRGVERTSATPGLFKTEYACFKDFFLVKTNIHWFDRVLKAGTGEKTDFSYTPPTGGKPVGGNLTKNLTFDECVRRNIELRRLWAELFGDELAAGLATDNQIESEMEHILEDIINEVCAYLQ